MVTDLYEVTHLAKLKTAFELEKNRAVAEGIPQENVFTTVAGKPTLHTTQYTTSFTVLTTHCDILAM